MDLGTRSVATTSRLPSSVTATSPVVVALATINESIRTGTLPPTSQMLTLLPWTLRTLQLVVYAVEPRTATSPWYRTVSNPLPRAWRIPGGFCGSARRAGAGPGLIPGHDVDACRPGLVAASLVHAATNADNSTPAAPRRSATTGMG